VVVDYPGANTTPVVGAGKTGVSVLEATGATDSPLATSDTSFVMDELGNLLKVDRKANKKW
jgi:hypothetical protein